MQDKIFYIARFEYKFGRMQNMSYFQVIQEVKKGPNFVIDIRYQNLVNLFK